MVRWKQTEFSLFFPLRGSRLNSCSFTAMHRTPAYLTAQTTAFSPYLLKEGLLKIQLLSKTELQMQRCTLHLCTISQPGWRNSKGSFVAVLQNSSPRALLTVHCPVRGDDLQLTVEVRCRPGEVRRTRLFGLDVQCWDAEGEMFSKLSDWSGWYFYHLCYSRLIFDRTGKCITFKLRTLLQISETVQQDQLLVDRCA